MTTGATIHTTAGLGRDITPRRFEQPPQHGGAAAAADHAAGHAAGAAAGARPAVEQREVALAFTEAPPPQA